MEKKKEAFLFGTQGITELPMWSNATDGGKKGQEMK